MGRRLLPALGIALCLALPAEAQPVNAGVGERVRTGFVEPNLAAFGAAAADLRAGMGTLCAAPASGPLAAARELFARTVTAFSRVSVLRFGPLAAENRFERLFFWPDARGVTPRQVEALIAGQDEGATSPAALSGMSVAVQGLPALEIVLHGTGSEALLGAEKPYRCRYGEAIAANVADLAASIEDAWAPEADFTRSFVEPGPGRDPYRSDQEVAGEVVKALGTGLQFVREAELLPALGEGPERARGRRAPLWRSGLTFALVQAQIGGLDGLLASAGFDAALSEEAASNLATIAFDLEQAAAAIGAIGTPVEAAFNDEADHERIRYVTVALMSAQRNISEGLSAGLGLTMGFNALDGD